jgi:hypothetical protein
MRRDDFLKKLVRFIIIMQHEFERLNILRHWFSVLFLGFELLQFQHERTHGFRHLSEFVLPYKFASSLALSQRIWTWLPLLAVATHNLLARLFT